MKAFRPVVRHPKNTAATHAVQPQEILPRSALSILGFYLLLVLMIMASTWALITQDWVRQQKIQETEISSLARALAEKLAHDLGNTERALFALETTLQETGKSATLDARLNARAQLELDLSPQIASLSVWTPHSILRTHVQQAGQLGAPLHPPPSVQVFRRNQQTRLLIAPAIRGSNGEFYLPVERVIYNARREVLGYATALVNIGGLDRYMQAIRLTAQDTASILDNNGNVLTRIPSDSQAYNPGFKKLITRKAGSALADTPIGTSFEIDDTQHIGVLLWLKKPALIIATSRPAKTASASFSVMKHRLLLGSGILIVLLGLLAWLMYYDSRRHREARVVLRRINASLEERVGRRTAELEQSNREMIAFSYSISHDLRAPLRAINGFAHALREDFSEKLDEQGKDYLDRICRASVRMGELIDELLSLANVSRAPLIVRELDLAPIASDIIEELRLANPERQVIFQAQSGLKTEGDEALLRNALMNLIGNAWKFTRARRPAVISLTAEEDSEFVRFTLADNGIGFDMAHAKRLFQPFQQLHGDQGFGGTGIGLASVRRIIERHGGQIWAEATPEEGARFIFTLPLRAHVIRRRQRS